MDNLENYEQAEIIMKNLFEVVDKNPNNYLSTN